MSLSLSEYEDFVLNLMSPDSMESFKAKISTAGLGLGGEGGECAELTKKVLFHGLEFNDQTRNKFIKELGDVMFYLTFAATQVCGVSVQHIIDANVDKLSDRYKDGKFSTSVSVAKELKKDE